VTERGARWTSLAAWLLLAVAMAEIAGALYLAAHRRPHQPGLDLGQVLFATRFICLTAVGAVIAARRAHQIGWLLLSIGLVYGTVGIMAEGSRTFYSSQPALGAILFLASNELFKVALLLLVVLILIFPTGHLPSRRWRWLTVALVIVVGLGILGEVTTPGRVPDFLVSSPPGNPLALSGIWFLELAAGSPGLGVFAGLLVLAATSVAFRFKRGNSELRLQLKWFTLAAGLLVLTVIADGIFQSIAHSTRRWEDLPFVALYFVATMGMAAAIGIAILRHRLFDVDLVISRTVAYGFLLALIAGFYIALVAGMGTLLTAGSSSRLVLAVVATAAVAVAFQPLRTRLESFANQLVYGRRASPYEVLAEFTAGLDRSQASDELPTMARLLARGTACDSATVWLWEGKDEIAASTWPADQLVHQDVATRCVQVRQHGEFLGRLAVFRISGQPLTPTEERLMDRLGQQAGLVLRNASLQDELRQRLEELRASRQRLVRVQDDERRRLERDLHDGAQQHLISMRMKLGLASAAARRKPEEVDALVEEMQQEVGEALDSLRGLASGVYPPLLEAEGLRAGLSARARQVSVPVDIRCGPARYPRELEGATYFCCSEALQNMEKHAEATRGSIHVWREGARLFVEVKDDGRGFAPNATRLGRGLHNIHDRVDALGGSVEVVSTPGASTVVKGWLPLAPEVSISLDSALRPQQS
jgi:signal transduction histidine kinase